MYKRQAVVNAGLTLNFTDEKEKEPATGKAWYESWCYEQGIADYVAEVAGEDTLTLSLIHISPSSENAMPELPRTLRHCSLKNYSSAEYGRSKMCIRDRVMYFVRPPADTCFVLSLS